MWTGWDVYFVLHVLVFVYVFAEGRVVVVVVNVDMLGSGKRWPLGFAVDYLPIGCLWGAVELCVPCCRGGYSISFIVWFRAPRRRLMWG